MNEKRNYLPAVTLAALTGLNLLNYIDRYLLPSMATPVQKALGLNDDQYGTAFSAFMVGYFLTSPIFGYLGDRMPRKWLIAAGVLVWSAGTALSGTASGLMMLLFFRVLVGFGEASFGTISPSIIADLYPPEKRNNAISFFSAALPVGIALGFILGGQIEAHFGWRYAFYFAGIPGLLLAFALLKLPEPKRGASEPPGSPKPEEQKDKGARAYLTLLGIPAFLLSVAGYAAQTFAMGGFGSFAATFFERVHHMSLTEADNFFGLSLVISGFLATCAGGYLGTRWRKRHAAGYAWVLVISAAVGLPAAVLTFVLTTDLAAKAALIATMFLLMLPNGPINTVILETVPVRMRASAMAATIFAIHLFGDLPSPKIIGWFSVFFGQSSSASDAVNAAALQKAVLYTLPWALAVSAFFWIWLAVYMGRRAKPLET